ncbi:MAG: pilin [Patescibacteria group bacterium]|nr:pilin [Patescibacteria group bacterium]
MIKKFLVFAVLASVLLLATPVLAQTNPCGANDPLCLQPAQQIGLGTSDIRVTIARIIKVAMGLLGIVAVVIVLIGGFTWMTAGGDETKTGNAKKWIFGGVIGLAIILSAYALTSFVINSLMSATTGV